MTAKGSMTGVNFNQRIASMVLEKFNFMKYFREITAFDTIPSDNSDEDVEYQPEIWVCRSDYHNVWLGKWMSTRNFLRISCTTICHRLDLWVQGTSPHSWLVSRV